MLDDVHGNRTPTHRIVLSQVVIEIQGFVPLRAVTVGFTNAHTKLGIFFHAEALDDIKVKLA
jgi:hypothetical protein